MASRLVILLFLFAPIGCGAMRPKLQNPGPAQFQQYNAILHDPYADKDAGPEVVGVRPREFSNPQAEPVRARWLRDSFWGGR